ncbi:SDR family NAD(P)-dependent oxidoreductase [Microlunatus capsulatus]|uniref:NAD(P)-dependent dehydrogenase (Short-subunit alcohol dehydrogenase family) n=1 Tax=Microlunatus capsulatus TaxID=99117 RepID=A0ABS4Z4T7_9ACTN|nr:SDR family NAD(P)-dependent oxidoreductase [Microlunatus capsulatus]MBP2416057.1 NAD(P)-dependent dehydrogenase (short-subunit alcohol dehydrogenase family) [Microlunatus capsulatus]
MGEQDARVVVVTGASSGIGLASALAAAERGDHVVLLARGAEALEDAAQQCRTAGAASALALPTDVADDAAVRAAFAEVAAQLGPVDAVVHSAGLVAYGRLEEVPVEIFDRVVATNLLGSVNIARAVLPQMRERNAGTLVLIGSLIGYLAPPYMSAYAVSKWGVRGLARLLQVENVDRDGVHVCHLSPGGVDTPIYLQAANYLGWVGRPPPPVVSPERVARAALRLLDHPRPRIQVGPANWLTMAGFTLAPAVFDRIVTPLFVVGATDVRRAAVDVPGNVLASVPEGNRLHGGQGSPVASIAAGLRARLGRRRRPRA